MTFGVAVDKPDANIAMQKTKSVLIIFFVSSSWKSQFINIEGFKVISE
jgi:hypothetical protein